MPIPRNHTTPWNVVSKEKLVAEILGVLIDVIDLFDLVTGAAERLGAVSTGDDEPIPRRAWWPAPPNTSTGAAGPAQ